MNLETLHVAVSGNASAIRCITRLQPAGGSGTSVFPPTYVVGDEGGNYAIEARQVGGAKVEKAVLLDSVPSQANRIEEALQRAIDEKRISLPLLVVTLPPDQRVTSLEAPHRIADAIFRDSEIGNLPFRDSEAGKAFVSANVKDATALFQLCPTALIFGTWDSTGASGGLGNKFARALVSEVIGYHAEVFKKTAGRIDPLAVTKMELHVKNDDPAIYDVPATGMEPPTGFKKGKPSEINHGNVAPSLSDGGVTIAWAEQTSVVSLPALRRLRFPIDGKLDKDKEDAARTVLAALALVGLTLTREQGYDFRSRCQLIPEDEPEFELLGTTLKDVTKFKLTTEEAITILNEAVAAAQKAGLKWDTKPLTLSPSTRLKKLVEAARAARTAGE
ncbi:MAG: type I-U CRISPR-associated RAMP protein Csb1/Cas7u [Chthoniobacter sp.]